MCFFYAEEYRVCQTFLDVRRHLRGLCAWSETLHIAETLFLKVLKNILKCVQRVSDIWRRATVGNVKDAFSRQQLTLTDLTRKSTPLCSLSWPLADRGRRRCGNHESLPAQPLILRNSHRNTMVMAPRCRSAQCAQRVFAKVTRLFVVLCHMHEVESLA